LVLFCATKVFLFLYFWENWEEESERNVVGTFAPLESFSSFPLLGELGEGRRVKRGWYFCIANVFPLILTSRRTGRRKTSETWLVLLYCECLSPHSHFSENWEEESERNVVGTFCAT